MIEVVKLLAFVLLAFGILILLTRGDDLAPFRRGYEACTLKRAENPSALCEYTWCVSAQGANSPLLCYGQDGRAWGELFYDARRGFR